MQVIAQTVRVRVRIARCSTGLKWPPTGEIILLMVVALPVYFYFQGEVGLRRPGP